MNTTIYGALPAEWRQIASISAFEGHVLEVVSAPESVIPSGTDTTKGPNRGKIPSCVSNGKVYGILGWTTNPLGGRETLARYEAEATTDKGYWRGAYLRTGHNGVIAIDCDIEDPDISQIILNDLTSILKVKSVSVRRRPNSARWLALVKITDGPAFARKVVISAPPVVGADGLRKPQQVECLGSGAGCVLAGTHPSGERYTWSGGVYVYSMTRDKFTEFRDLVHARLTEGLSDDAARELIGAAYEIDWCETEKQASASRSKIPLTQAQMDSLIEDDPTIKWLKEIGYPIIDRKEDGGIRLRCPNSAEHSNGNAEAVYYPVGNYRCEDTGGFKCLHAHCAGLSKAGFIRKIAELPEYRDKAKPGPECFLSRPHEIQFGDETEAAEESKVQAAKAEDARKIQVKRMESAAVDGVVERDRLGASEESTRPDDLRKAREALKPYRIKNKDGGYDDECPSYLDTNLAIHTAMQHPVICGMDIRADNYKRVITVRPYGSTERRPLMNEDYTRVLNNLEAAGFRSQRSSKLSKTSIVDQLDLHAREMEYDDMAEFVARCVPKWDGVPRIDTMLVDHFHAHVSDIQTPAYYTAAARYFMMAMVKRAITTHTPVKADDVIVLYGAQGCGKSTAVACLALRPGDALEGLSFTYDAGEWAIRINGHIIAEVPEMSGFSKKDVSDVKFVLSQCEDTYRPKYEKVTVTRPRRCMAILTTNDPQALTDSTGNRRFLVVEIEEGERIDTQWIRDNIFQIWAEALHMLEVSKGYIPQREAEELGAPVAELFVKKDPIRKDVLEQAANLYKSHSLGVETSDIIAAIGTGSGLLPDRRGAARVNEILVNNGWIMWRPRQADGSRPELWKPKSKLKGK